VIPMRGGRAAAYAASAMTIALLLVGDGHCIEIDSAPEKLGYSMGYQLGSELGRQRLEVDPSLVVLGAMDALSGARPAIATDDMRQELRALRVRARDAAAAALERESRANLEAGDEFLKRNAERDDVVVLASGVQYEILLQGKGRHPSPEGRVVVHYHGTLLDGEAVDSSLRRSAPTTLRIAGSIPAWREVLPLMREGARWRLFVPPQLAYGAVGVADKIPPNSTLIYDIDLLDADVEE